jgi:hypothetical protein
VAFWMGLKAIVLILIENEGEFYRMYDMFLCIFIIFMTVMLGLYIYKRTKQQRVVKKKEQEGIVYEIDAKVETISQERYVGMFGRKSIRAFIHVSYTDKNGCGRLAKIYVKSHNLYHEDDIVTVKYNSNDHKIYNLHYPSLAMPIASFIIGVILSCLYVLTLIISLII